MNVAQAHTLKLSKTLARAMRAVVRQGTPKSVHLLRTTTRRIDALLAFSGKPDDKLRRQLRALRRRAGVLRDIDVQLAALQTIHVPGAMSEQRTVMRALERRREKRVRKLREVVVDEARSLRKRLREPLAAAAASTDQRATPDGAQIVRRALDQFAEAVAHRTLGREEDLHALRIDCKKVRYTAEIAGEHPAAIEVVENLKHIQDAIGQWRDWTMLVNTANRALDHPERSVLLNALRAHARASLFRALRVATDATEHLLAMRRAKSGRKQPVPADIRGVAARAS